MNFINIISRIPQLNVFSNINITYYSKFYLNIEDPEKEKIGQNISWIKFKFDNLFLIHFQA